MKKVFDLARTEERKACEAMGRVQKTLDSEISRLNELESYRQRYAKQFKGNQTISPARWQDYQNFLKRIDQAVDAQKVQVMSGRETRDRHRRHWLVRRQKLESLERVVDRFQKAEHVEAERRMQKNLDDLTATSRYSSSDIED